jgi:hypothetical protein
MNSFGMKQVMSATAAFAVLVVVLTLVFADVTSVARAQQHHGARSFAAVVSALGL